MLFAGQPNKKWIFFIILLCAMCVGCQSDLEPTHKNTMEKISIIEDMEEERLETIPIKYPFPYAIKGYTLALVASTKVPGQYDL